MIDNPVENDKQPGDLRADQFFDLFMGCQKQLFYYILALVPNSHHADDILQETATTLWKKFDDFQEGTNFLAWAIAIARYQVLRFRRKKYQAMQFNESLWEQLESAVCQQHRTDREYRFSAVEECVNKLAEKDQQLIQLRYNRNLSVQKVAGQMGRSRTSLYRSLARVHGLLYNCIQKTLTEWGLT